MTPKATRAPEALPAVGAQPEPGVGRAAGEARCDCRSCIKARGDTISGIPRLLVEFIVCPTCGDKRCVHAKDHEAPCAVADVYAHNLWVERNLLFAPPEAPNVEFSGVPAGHSSNHPAGGTSAGTQGSATLVAKRGKACGTKTEQSG